MLTPYQQGFLEKCASHEMDADDVAALLQMATLPAAMITGAASADTGDRLWGALKGLGGGVVGGLGGGLAGGLGGGIAGALATGDAHAGTALGGSVGGLAGAMLAAHHLGKTREKSASFDISDALTAAGAIGSVGGGVGGLINSHEHGDENTVASLLRSQLLGSPIGSVAGLTGGTLLGALADLPRGGNMGKGILGPLGLGLGSVIGGTIAGKGEPTMANTITDAARSAVGIPLFG